MVDGITEVVAVAGDGESVDMRIVGAVIDAHAVVGIAATDIIVVVVVAAAAVVVVAVVVVVAAENGVDDHMLIANIMSMKTRRACSLVRRSLARR